jgi:putative membrane protein
MAMFWYDHDLSGWGWFAMSASMILFWALIITAAVLFFRAVNRPDEHTHTSAAPTPEQILDDRFARGEINEDEYRRRLNALHAGPLTKP